ncbi:MAG: DUF3078 domain-containing protein [Capnocytophaga sp.]|jgi:hypothetical protein|uniref:Outer membrane insertion signal domain protein n=2 Tax=Capnocytophaga ochracea TaxID=1018 RepID=E4MTS6_CAPOC|nr:MULTISPECIES: DUF3078 domain-containing protein [Capnocytophaga]ALC97571.1 hypothetical protein AM608_07910 [Capnocytophaga sp. oral taxon 323]EFS96882.1 outer membrane insertion signal domain protein [Capnocytophaga ochracea F0287]EIW93030.1 PF11276 family protein [Capnocytophaga sp. oral taxon 412 str. F0487]EJF35763.1 PF11276 family protein [Capnocytophaga sp. oral taxon 335 str. F0486]EJF45492.1 PF11276 family protein [Capnocytophaga ochracea str. Holt 25]
MKRLLFSTLLLSSVAVFAQEDQTNDGVAQDPTAAPTEEAPAPRWTKGGNASLMFSQAAFNHDWTGGGTNNVAASLAVSYAFNYKKDKWAWDNNVFVDYGITKLEGDDYSRKTTDRFEVNSVLGYQLNNPQWYYSFFLNFKTQMTDGYKYESTGRTLINQMLSPGYLQFGPGMLWKKSDNLKVNLAPATSKITTAKSRWTETGPFYGVEQGKNIRYELGFYLNGYAKFTVMDNVSFENILSLYSNYLDKPQNVDLDYTANIVMTINKYLSANFTFQAIYDDDAAKAFQIREVLGLGVNYKF